LNGSSRKRLAEAWQEKILGFENSRKKSRKLLTMTSRYRISASKKLRKKEKKIEPDEHRISVALQFAVNKRVHKLNMRKSTGC
jgi:hypothetical protein